MDLDKPAPITHLIRTAILFGFVIPAIVAAGILMWPKVDQIRNDLVPTSHQVGGFTFTTAGRPTHSTACASLTTGELAQHLTAEPCAELTAREFTATADGPGTTVTVHVTWLRMPDEATAEHLHQLTADRANGSTQPVVMGVTFLPEHTATRTGATVTIVRAGTRTGLPAAADVVHQAAAAALNLTPSPAEPTR